MELIEKQQLFIARNGQIGSLERLLSSPGASLVVIRGRRRIGKSRLIMEFAHRHPEYTYLSLTGLPPAEKTTQQGQLDEISRQLGEQLNINGISFNDWGDLFTFLANQIKKKKTIILLDEISWMGSKDPDFLGKLKVVWDLHLQHQPNLMLVLCGSVSAWIEKNILSSTGFFGRVHGQMLLDELSLDESCELLRQIGFNGSPMEFFQILSITGGVPWYLELIDPKKRATGNIQDLCFSSDGILVDEFKRIFHDLFGRRSEIYERIVNTLVQNPLTYSDIAQASLYAESGTLSEYLNDLELAGFIRKHSSWDFKGHKAKGRNYFRLTDNYLRFYMRFMSSNIEQIKEGHYEELNISTLPGWDSVMGLQFENLILNNKKCIYKKLNLRPEDIVKDNPYVQRKTSVRAGCQIDYLIQTKYNTLFVCEIKFSRRPIGTEVIDQVKEKISRLSIPRGFACVPILIHANDVSDSLISSGYFAECIDAAEFLET